MQLFRKATITITKHFEIFLKVFVLVARTPGSVDFRRKVVTVDGQFELNTPRDRHGSFEPLVVKIRQDRRVINKSVYLALGVNMEGHKYPLAQKWLPQYGLCRS